MANNIPAAFGLNRYLWSKLNGAVLDPANYNGLVPIIPIQEEPQFLQAMDAQDGIVSFPYIVYTWYSNGYGPNWFYSEDRIIYMVHAGSNAKLREVILMITSQFKRHDESARVVNSFTQSLGEAYQKYDYKYISVDAVQGGSYTTAENVPVKGQVTVCVRYSHDDDNRPL